MALIVSCCLSAGAACERNEHGVIEDVGCASEALSVADRELNASYRELLAKLEPEQKTLLVRSQRAWLDFLKAESAFIFSVEGDGSSGRLVVTNFRESHTRLRVQELRNWKIN
jgi:uncharacterized protein YecT (DUF1311 family)